MVFARLIDFTRLIFRGDLELTRLHAQGINGCRCSPPMPPPKRGRRGEGRASSGPKKD
jgi:hypothetical protein